ncbi:transcription termination factor NusA [Dethiobacter alkaliphilus]|uniref:Transcription termination/antitermination protein NusA n=1 Tax=Dethiobacter alkaliphilus AHT 1 TaxID=555088 RepID=C0GIV5_DETAL|nr:transcription termination factor NusA [Dethiobacter alkaliphilus]EEG76769.1 NusA antitermination factor [Dethiobacter alkaliphilus AHT 1]
MNEEFLAAMDAIEKEKGVKKEVLFEAIEAALVSAYKRNFNAAANVRVQLNRESGEIKVYTRLEVVEEESNDPQLEISLQDAQKIDSRYEPGEIVEKEVTPKNFGRIAAQTAKQVVIQRIREAEREIVFDEYIDREEDIITGIVQRMEQKNVIMDLGKTEAVLLPTEQMPGDDYRQSERVKAYITEVKKTSKGPQIFVSRTHPGLLKRLFELEVPEIFDGTVEIKSVAREAGYRSKLAVYSKNKDVDPVGACVGPKGARVQAIVTELRGEKIDIVKWDEDPVIFVANSLSPAKVMSVSLHQEQKVASVVVPDYQLSLAIGKEGQNARLAAKLTGWKIDITSESQAAERQGLPVEERSELFGNDEDVIDPENTVPGVPDELVEAVYRPEKGDEDDETP